MIEPLFLCRSAKSCMSAPFSSARVFPHPLFVYLFFFFQFTPPTPRETRCNCPSPLSTFLFLNVFSPPPLLNRQVACELFFFFPFQRHVVPEFLLNVRQRTRLPYRTGPIPIFPLRRLSIQVRPFLAVAPPDSDQTPQSGDTIMRHALAPPHSFPSGGKLPSLADLAAIIFYLLRLHKLYHFSSHVLFGHFPLTALWTSGVRLYFLYRIIVELGPFHLFFVFSFEGFRPDTCYSFFLSFFSKGFSIRFPFSFILLYSKFEVEPGPSFTRSSP